MLISIALKLFMAWVIAGLKINQFKFSIRSKLLLISTVLLIVPWIGVTSIQDMEVFLREGQQENLLAKAQIVAAVLQGHASIFKSRSLQTIDSTTAGNYKVGVSHLYVRPIKRAIQLDGYMDDWFNFDEKSKFIVSDNPASLAYRYYLASYKNYIYIMLKVTDDQLIYKKDNSLSLDKNDHIIIKLINKRGVVKTYFIATQSPGWVNGHRMELRESGWRSVAPELRIKGEWQETLEGYNVEIRLPLSLIGDGFSFFVADVDDEKTGVVKRVLGENKLTDDLGSIIIPSLAVEDMLKRVVMPASRTWVIDKKFRVLAVAGDIRDDSEALNDNGIENKTGLLSNVLSVFYYLLLTQPTHEFKDELLSASFLRNKVVESAMSGVPSTSWRISPDNQVRILTASYPVLIDGKPIGAIAIEENSNAILMLQNRAMEILINLSLISFFITLIVLLSFASRLSQRVRQLRDQVEQAISNDGRIRRMFMPAKSSDEIGDLSRSFSDMLARLAEYNRYLETMAGKLSHELRTPITVARSSLENLKTAQSSEVREVYIQRASEGMSRLSDILTRMSEATRLEQTLQSEKTQQLDLSELIEACLSGYKIAYPDVNILLENNSTDLLKIVGVAELLAQMLDKLVANAIDFHLIDTPIVIKLEKYNEIIKLSVINQGEILPLAMRENLFESMVSVRHKKTDSPHLGLGLYIVRMIVEFHHGEVRAINLKNKEGVSFELEFPAL